MRRSCLDVGDLRNSSKAGGPLDSRAVVVSPKRNCPSAKTSKCKVCRGSIMLSATLELGACVGGSPFTMIVAESESAGVRLGSHMSGTRGTGNSLFMDVRTGSFGNSNRKARACCCSTSRGPGIGRDGTTTGCVRGELLRT